MGTSTNQQPSKTRLYDLHVANNARMVDFAGYSLPIQYRGIVEEHVHTRDRASLFDVSHMGQIRIKGEDFTNIARLLEKIIPANILELKQGEMCYSVLLNENGGIEDDLIISHPTDQQAQSGEIFIVVNGATKDKDLNRMRLAIGDSVDISLDDKSLIALQGPKAATVISRHTDVINKLIFMQTCSAIIAGIKCNISRSGYTGEDGFEISLNNEDAPKLAAILLNETEVELAGLGARDSLRLEAGLCLYGHDMDANIDPISASIRFAIGKRRKIEGGFIGATKIIELLKNGAKNKRIGILFDGRIPVREGAKLVDNDNNEIGYISSGGFSPILQAPIAMGYLPTDTAIIGQKICAIVRNKQVFGEIVKMPFVKNNYFRGENNGGGVGDGSKRPTATRKR